MSPARMEKVEAGMRVALAFQTAFNRHDSAAILQLLSDDCLFEYPSPAPDGTTFTGKEAIRPFWERFFLAAPDVQLEVEELFGFGARCILRWRRHWTDEAGQKRHLRGVYLFQVRDGLICEHLSYVKG